MTIAHNFVTAGHAIFTVSNPKGDRYTFKVSRPRSAKDDCPLFASLLTGPDNGRDYTYMGIYVAQGAQFGLRLTRKSKYNDDSLPVKVFRWIVRVLQNGKDLPEGYAVHHEGRFRCFRAP